MWICGRPPASRDKMKTNPWQRKGNKKKKKKQREREWRTESSQLMTGLLCISALTNEHSNKGELKDQCAGVHAAGKRGNLQGEMKEGRRKTIEWKEGVERDSEGSS